MSSGRHKRLGVTLITALSFTATIAPAIAQSGVGTGTVESRLALQSRNPIADLITVPIEYDFEFGSGTSDARTWTLLLHPVIPFNLPNDWRLVTRTIIPVIRQEAVTSTDQNESGLGDITQSFFLSPPNLENGWIVGAGPVFQYPSAAHDDLGAGKWGAGPTAAAIRQWSGWTLGGIVNHIWSFAGDSQRDDVSTTLVEPFFSYTWSNDFTLGFDCESTYDWKEQQWTVPLTAGVSQMWTIGKQSVSFGVDAWWYAAHADDASERGVALNMTLVFSR